MANYESNIVAVRKAIRQAEMRTLEAIGVFVVGEAVVRSPVDTGNLRGSYTHKVNEQAKSVVIGSPVEYAPYVEFGTRFMAAQAHLNPAIDDNQSRIKRLAKDMMALGDDNP